MIKAAEKAATLRRELLLSEWRASRDWCTRCGAPLLDAADEETHYFGGLCQWCEHQHAKLYKEED